MTCINPAIHCCDSGNQTLERVAKQLQLYKPPMLIDTGEDRSDGLKRQCFVRGERRASVLVCLFEGLEGELRVILTRRSMKLSSFPGDVALPGGKMDESDADDSSTALREAFEEIGLEPNLVRVVANLDPFICIHNHVTEVIPVIGLLSRIDDFKPALNTDEVDAMFDAPLEMFIKRDHHRFEEKEWMGMKYVVHNFEFKSQQGTFLIRGLTASILVQTASLIYQTPPCFEQNDLPDFQQLPKS